MSSLCRLVRVLVIAGVSQIAIADLNSWQGRRVSELLDELNNQGYQIIFSSDVVTDDLLITAEPNLSDPQKGVRALLGELGLVLEDGPAGTWLVKKRSQPTASTVVAISAPQPALPEIVVTSSLQQLNYKKTGTQTYLDRELATRACSSLPSLSAP